MSLKESIRDSENDNVLRNVLGWLAMNGYLLNEEVAAYIRREKLENNRITKTEVHKHKGRIVDTYEVIVYMNDDWAFDVKATGFDNILECAIIELHPAFNEPSTQIVYKDKILFEDGI
jgi:hypothetical protein